MSQNSENLNIKKCIWKKCLGTSKLTIDKFQLLNYIFRGLNFGQTTTTHHMQTKTLTQTIRMQETTTNHTKNAHTNDMKTIKKAILN